MWTIRAKLAVMMILALAPLMAVLSLVTTRLMQSTLQRQVDVTLDYVTSRNAIDINHDLSDLRRTVQQRGERILQTVTASVADGAVGDLIARGQNAEAGARLASALIPSRASMITVVGRDGSTLARATNPNGYGDRALWDQHLNAESSVTDLRPRLRSAFAGSTATGIVVLAPSTLMLEKVTPGAALIGLTRPGDLLSDQAWILLETGRGREARGLAMASMLPIPDRRGIIRGVALAARLMNRDSELPESYRQASERWMLACLGDIGVEGNLPTDHKTILGAVVPHELSAPILQEGKRRWTGRLAFTGVDLNAAAGAVRDLNGHTVGILISASPVTELQRVVDRMQADAARLENRSLIVLLIWLVVGSAAALILAALAARNITRPIHQLQAGARRIGDGDFSHRLQVRSGDELEQLASEFNLMAEHLQTARDHERLAVIGRMASTIVHDIQNTLTSIRGCAPLLAEEDLPSDQRREFAAILVESVQRIADMARDLLEFARGEEATLDLRAMNVDQYLAELRPHLERDFRESGIALALDLECPVSVRIDPPRMNRVIFNLAANARDAMGDNGTFTIASRCAGGYVEIRCSDTGPGIAEEVEGRLFQPFVSYGKPYGTGLGLAICRQIVEAHRGTIEAHSDPGEGATFIVRLPLAGRAEEEGAGNAHPEPTPGSAA
jgi:signal transduction histidine kinase